MGPKVAYIVLFFLMNHRLYQTSNASSLSAQSIIHLENRKTVLREAVSRPASRQPILGQVWLAWQFELTLPFTNLAGRDNLTCFLILGRMHIKNLPCLYSVFQGNTFKGILLWSQLAKLTVASKFPLFLAGYFFCVCLCFTIKRHQMQGYVFSIGICHLFHYACCICCICFL